jgi:NAD(P)-dependent dehydrogenase (short-subunit alcohol dehydrogenase family)
MNPQYDFRNNIALVTGAGKGMGLATPTAFAESLGSRAEPTALPSWSGRRTLAGVSRASNDVGVR